ncbi:MAG: restriction endonuclease subunit S [Azonexus sp.]
MSNKAEKRGLVPKLRFPEFRVAGEWVSQFADALFDQISNKDHNSDLPVLAITQEQGAIPRNLIGYHVSVTEKSIESYKVVEVGDFIISLRSFQGGIEYSNYKGICSPAYVILRLKAGYSADFFKNFLKTIRFITLLTKNLEGLRDGKMVSYKQFSELQLPTPSLNEQQKIADCLASLDELITLETHKLDTLKTHKKGLMQQLFPAEGETLPKLRFPEFQDAGGWEERRMGDICERIMDGTHFSPTSKAGPCLYLTSKNIQNGAIDLSNIFYISEEEHRQIYERCPVKKNDVLLTKDGANTGNCAINGIDFEFSLLSSVAVLRGNSFWLDQGFLYQLILADRTQKSIQESMSGQAITRITLEKIGNFSIPVTSIPEQQKVAGCLASLDDLITAQTQKLAGLKTHKKGLMQQLFPALDEVPA